MAPKHPPRTPTPSHDPLPDEPPAEQPPAAEPPAEQLKDVQTEPKTITLHPTDPRNGLDFTAYECPHCRQRTVPRVRSTNIDPKTKSVRRYVTCRHCADFYRIDISATGALIGVHASGC